MNHIRVNPKINIVLKSINISHLFAHKLNHAVSREEGAWILFEPSKFIYAFFTFNMIYEIDWKETFKRHRIWEYRSEFYTSTKIEKLLEFIYAHNTSKSFIDYYSEYDQSMDLIRNSNGITPDYNIDKNGYSDYLDKSLSYHENFKVALNNLGEDKFEIEDHYKAIIFCYQIRNNVFHGLKKATEMIEGGQRDRLLDYSHIILATNDMLFDVLQEHYGYRLAKDDELKENAGIIKY